VASERLRPGGVLVKPPGKFDIIPDHTVSKKHNLTEKMKTKSIILTLALGTALVGFTGCNKSETKSEAESTSPATPTMGEQVKSAVTNAVTETKEAAAAAVDKTKEVAAAATETAKEAATAVKEGAEKVATEVKEKVEGTDSSMTAKAQELIDKAKALIGESKYKEALESLQGLANFKLTEEQQKVVDDLKEQIQKGLSAAGVSNLLGQ
jgi:hypothetical protein